jgi:hypothetical protein
VIRKSEGGLLSAAVGVPISGFAWLTRFRRVDAEQPDALAVDLDRIAVDDGRAAGHVACGGRPCAGDCQKRDDFPARHDKTLLQGGLRAAFLVHFGRLDFASCLGFGGRGAAIVRR